jgi:hypothetical protein
VVAGLVVVLLAGVGYAAVSSAAAAVGTGGPTAVRGTAGSAVFHIADRTVRQVRYRDDATLTYTFRLTNHQALPVTVTGISARQRDERLFGYAGLEDQQGRRRFTISGHGSTVVRLLLHMGGCESLSARAGSFVHEIMLDTERLGVPSGTATVRLPEEVHTGSPREAFCPNSTARSRPPG